MSHPQPPQRQPTPAETFDYAKAVHYTAWLGVIAFPILALAPPRKLDPLTIGLIGGTVFSGNYLYRERYGRSILQRISGTSPGQTSSASNMQSSEIRSMVKPAEP